MTVLRPKELGLHRGHLLVVVTGTIAAASVPGQLETIRGWYPDVSVRVLVTKSATEFVSPVLLRVASRNSVLGPGWFEGVGDLHVPHRQLAAWADAIVVMPASGNTLAKLAAGIADSLALATVQDAECPVIIVPAVSPGVLSRGIFADNVRRLRDGGFRVMEPVEGRRASDGSVGLGAPASIPDVLLDLARACGALRSLRNGPGGRVSATGSAG